MARPKMKEDSLDKLLAALDEEYSRQILQLEELARMAGEVHNKKVAKRLEQLQAFREQLIGQAVDDDTGEVINPDIEEAYSFLENEALPDPEEAVASLKERLQEEIDSLKERYQVLKDIRKDLPPNAFFLVEEDDEDDDEDEEEEEDEATDLE
jgi:hypothetical protein